jgi:hypothetical protein
MNEQTPQKNNEKQKEIVVPPEPVQSPEIPATFNSPILFKKEETKTDFLEDKEVSHGNKKTVIVTIFAIIFVLISIISIVQISIFSRFESFGPNDFKPNEGSDFVLSEEENQNQNNGNLTCGDTPSISILKPEKDFVFQVGDTALFQWELCGISSSLFNKAMIDYFDKETGEKKGTFSLYCLATPVSKNGIQELAWKIPDFLEVDQESLSQTGCLVPVVNFLEPYMYKMTLTYANNMYSRESDFFFIEAGEYEYIPPTFEDYSITPVTSFDRSPFIDSSAPAFLKDIIFPAYFQAPPLFANYYRLYVIPWGPSFVIDLRDGKVYPSPQSFGQVVAKPFSNLYITEEALSTTNKQFKGRTHRISWSVFDEETKDFNLLFKRICTIESGTINHTYKDCIPE